jgi:hypothetical protein
MVAIQDGVHDHGDGELCPGCQFKAVLAEHLEWAAGDDDLAWHDLTSELIVLMGTAISTLAALRVAGVDGQGTPDNTAMAAAAAVSRLGGVIEELHAALMDDDGEGQGDD